MKLFIIVCAILHTVIGNEDVFRRLDAIVQEEPCSSAGGTCTVLADCPKDRLPEKSGLCPQQQNQGVDCCYGVSIKETRCMKHGGVCVKETEFCNLKLIRDATDCSPDHKCCIMV